MAKSKFSSQRVGAFKSRHFDNQFMRTLSFSIYGGSTVGECYYVASQINDGDFDQWVEAWSSMARRVERAARKSLNNGNIVSARKAFLRASEYYRAAEFHVFFGDEPKRKNLWEKHRDTFIEFGNLSPYSVERVLVPFEGQKLPGYFLKPDETHQMRPTLIAFGGGDSSEEESFFYIGKAALDRGYNVLQIAGPGQRGTAHVNPGSVFIPDYERPVEEILNYVLNRDDVDPEKLALYGLSYGGYIVLRGAMFDPRVKACVANPAWLDMYSFFRKGLPEITHNMSLEGAARILGIATRVWKLGAYALQQFYGIYGVDSPAAVFETMQQYNNYGLENKINCPLLLVVGEGEGPELMRQQKELLAEASSNNKVLYIFKEEDGGDAHCITNNLIYHNQVIFDWLAEVFELRG